MAEFRQHHSQSELDGVMDRPLMPSGPPLQFHKSPAVGRIQNHLAEPKLPQVLQPIQQRPIEPMNVSESLFETLPKQPTSSNYVLSGAHSLNANTKRGGAESLMSYQQGSPTQLGEYFQKMQAQWSMGGSAEQIQTTAIQGNSVYMGTQQPRLGGNRSNSQAVRGQKGRNTNATTNVLMQVRDKVQEQRDKHLLMGGQRTPGELVESLSQHSNGTAQRLNSHIGSAASINNSKWEQREEELSLEQIKTPLKNVKSRLNRNRTTENQNSRGQASSSLVDRRVNMNQFTTPDVIGIRVNAALQKQQEQSGGGAVKLRNFNQRITGKHRLQPINLTSKISTESFKKPIHSGSYVVEMLNPTDMLLQPKQIGNQNNSQMRGVLQQQQQTTQNSAIRVNKSRQSNPARDHSTQQHSIQPQNGFKSSQSGKIPLLKKEQKRAQQRSKNSKIGESAQNIREGSYPESQTPQIDQKFTKDELMVTFFDKSLVQKRMSQEEILPKDQQLVEHQDLRGEDNLHVLPQRFSQQDSIAVEQSQQDGRRQSTQSDGQVSRTGLFNEVVLRGGRETEMDVFVQAPTMQHQSQKNLSSIEPIHSREQRQREFNQLDNKLNGSMVMASSAIGENLVNMRNMNPAIGLYNNNNDSKRRRSKPSISLQRAQPLSSSGGHFFDEMASLVLGSQDSAKQQVLHESSLRTNNLNRSMLVQECDLSQHGVNSSVGAVDLSGNDESGRRSVHSISKNLTKLQRKEPQQSSSHNQSSVQVGVNSQLTKTYNLRGKMNNAKSKVNMKSFLINNGKQQKKMLTPNRMIASQQSDFDHASQRSIVESTNAYILATQHVQEVNNRIQYLQSAGTIPSSYQHGNGLSEADIGGPSRYDFVASSSVPYRAALGNNHLITSQIKQNSVIAHQSHQHFPLPHQLHQSGRMLEPLAQYSLHQQLKNPPTDESVRPQRDASHDLDPDIALYQLRQDVTAPLQTFEMKSRQSQLSNNSMNLPQVSGIINMSRMSQQQINSQYQTIAQQQSEASNTLKMALEQTVKPQSNMLFSAEKTRYEQQNLYKVANNPNNAFNLATMNKIEGNSRMQQMGTRQKSSNNTHLEAAYSNQLDNTTDENPFKKGPKLHLFKKSRMLKTSSAARQFSDDEEIDEQSVITGIAQQTSSKAVNNKYNGQGIDTNNTTIQASQQSFVYSTIEQKSQNDKLVGLKPRKIIHSSAPSNEKLETDEQNDEEAQVQQLSRSDMIAVAANSYMAVMRQQQTQDSDEKLRPLTSEFYSVGSNAVTTAVNAYQDAQEQAQMFEGLELNGGDPTKPASSGSKHSNASSMNAEHNVTANFNVVPAADVGSGYAMNGSRHSFYGTQTVAQSSTKESGKTSPKKTVKSSIILNDTRSSGPISKINSQESSKRKQTQENKAMNRKVKPVLRNKMVPTGKYQNKNQEKVMKGIDLNQTFNNVKIDEKSPDVMVKKSRTQALTNNSGSAEQLVTKKIISEHQSQEYITSSPQTAYNSRQKPQLESSNERLTRNDSAKTPYFVPTPQRTTGSNWGDQAYQQHSGSQQSVVGNSKSIKVEQAIQSLRSGEALRSGFNSKAASGNLHNSNIKIEMQQNPKIAAVANRSRQAPVKAEPDPNDQDEYFLQDAMHNQTSFDAKRKNLQSSNKTYRGTTAQNATATGVGRKNYTKQAARQNQEL